MSDSERPFTLHNAMRKFAQETFDNFGILLMDVHISWTDVSTISDRPKKMVDVVEIITLSKEH